MMYGSRPQHYSFKRVPYQVNSQSAAGSSQVSADSAAMNSPKPNSPSLETIKLQDRIPLPNEREIIAPDEDSVIPPAGYEPGRITRNRRSPSFSNIFKIFGKLKNNISLDDIILLGIIFLLLEEGIADDILLVLLVYIFLTGRE